MPGTTARETIRKFNPELAARLDRYDRIRRELEILCVLLMLAAFGSGMSLVYLYVKHR
jgi:hypothetical protein